MSTNTELQALLSKMGGTPTEQDTNSDLIKKINEVYESGGSGGESSGGVSSYNDLTDRPFNVSLSSTTLFDETVTTVLEEGNPAAVGFTEGWTIDSMDSLPESIIVTFEGTEYVCQKNISTMGPYYGATVDESDFSYDFSEFPFTIAVIDETEEILTGIITESAGTYLVKAEVLTETVTTTEDFEKAVVSVTNTLIVTVTESAGDSAGETVYTLNKTWKEIHDAFYSGKNVILHNGNIELPIGGFLTNGSNSEAPFSVFFIDVGASFEYNCATENSYPMHIVTTV